MSVRSIRRLHLSTAAKMELWAHKHQGSKELCLYPRWANSSFSLIFEQEHPPQLSLWVHIEGARDSSHPWAKMKFNSILNATAKKNLTKQWMNVKKSWSQIHNLWSQLCFFVFFSSGYLTFFFPFNPSPRFLPLSSIKQSVKTHETSVRT